MFEEMQDVTLQTILSVVEKTNREWGQALAGQGRLTTRVCRITSWRVLDDCIDEGMTAEGQEDSEGNNTIENQ